MDYIISNGELYHWGIKGMKWGVRRYQNPDGSLTPAGRKRYSDMEARLKAEEKVVRTQERNKAKLDKLKAKEAELEARKKALRGESDDSSASDKKSKTPDKADPPAKKKSVSEMTDDELRTAVNRKRLEEDYHKYYPEKVSKGKQFANTVVTKVVAPVAIEVGKAAAKAMLTAAINKTTGLDIKADQKNKDSSKDKK